MKDLADGEVDKTQKQAFGMWGAIFRNKFHFGSPRRLAVFPDASRGGLVPPAKGDSTAGMGDQGSRIISQPFDRLN
jgi:hypothetical protein